MKKRILYIAALLFTLSSLDAGAQHVVMNATIDTIQMRIGEQTRIKLELSVDSGYGTPEFTTDNMPGKIEVLETKNDVRQLNQGKRKLYSNEYLITCFDSATYVIPPFKAVLDTTEYLSNGLVLAVYSVPVDTANINNIAPPKDVWGKKLSWDELRDVVYLTFLVLFSLALLVWIIVRLVKNKPIIRIVKIKPRLPSHVNAMNRIEEIKRDNSWRVDGDDKRYYTALTDVLREYMCERFGFNATEMTTPEIIAHLQVVADKDSINELQDLLIMADLVKFAKMKPAMNENDRNLICAIEFIEKTKDIEEEKRPQPTEKRIVSKRTVRQKWILIASVIGLSLLFISVVILLVFDLSNLLG